MPAAVSPRCPPSRWRGDGAPVEGAWAAGDCAAVPDLTSEDPEATCAPTAQHAVRQAKLLADNLVAVSPPGTRTVCL